MKADELRTALRRDDTRERFAHIYACTEQEAESYISRVEKAVNRFEEWFGAGRDLYVFSAPGRTEVGGNHTDHQRGRVLAAGVNLALDRLDAHLAELAAVNNNAYVPWLIIISDGDSTEPSELVGKAAARVQEMLRARRLKTMCLNMGEGSRSLNAFAENGSVGRLENLKVVDFFEMLSRSVSETSKQVIESGGPDFSVQG